MKVENRFYTLFILSVIVSFIANAQTKRQDERKKEESFAFIEDYIDSFSLKFIKAFQCISKEGDDISSLLRSIRIAAQELGANCFKLKNFARNDTTGVMALTLNTYYATDSILEMNFRRQEKNTVYLFSDDKFSGKEYSFSMNNEKVVIKSGGYFKYILKEGEEIKLNKGGLMGTTVWIKWAENNPPRYFTFSGFGVADNPIACGNQAAIGFTAGKIKQMPTNVGCLLSALLKRKE